MKTFFNKVFAIANKELKHIARDPFTLGVAVLLPLLFVDFFGFVIDLDYKSIPLAVRDNSQSSFSRRLLTSASESGYFQIKPVHSPLAAEKLIFKNSLSALLIIPPSFAKDIVNHNPSHPAKLQLLIDGSDNTQASMLANYMQGILSFVSSEFVPSASTSLQLRTRYLFNPELNSKWFIVPALSTIIIGFLSIILTAITVAKEWENGSMELLLSTPVSPLEIVFGKLLPYSVLSLLDVLIVFLMAIFIFKIPFVGSFSLYLIASIIYIVGALALGLLISVLTRLQQTAIQFGFAIGLLPSFIFSGFIFPIENMPPFFRVLTAFFPQRWFLNISRTLFLSDPNFSSLIPSFIGLLLFAILMVLLAVKKFKTDVEP